MKKSLGIWLLAVLLAALNVFSAAAEDVIQINGELEPKTVEETLAMLEEETQAYYQDPQIAEELKSEIEHHEDAFPGGEVNEYYSLTHDGKTMRFKMEVRGKADENGRYPLYITLHGGGESEPESNDGEWFTMFSYYRESVKDGIYIACRGISDTWDLHFQPDSYPLYDRLIQSMIYLYQADPNRVYLMGFSAGGDGVYQITPRMADRFAAANMSSGHPNGVYLINLANCPFSIQVGVRDYYSESAMRCIRAAEFERTLSEYHALLDYGYEHQVLVRVPAGHNYDDYTDFGYAVELMGEEYRENLEENFAEVLEDPTIYAEPAVVEPMLNRFLEALQKNTGLDDISTLSYTGVEAFPAFDEEIRHIVTEEFGLETKKVDGGAVSFVKKYTRNPVPPYVIWDLATRAPSRSVTSFYWLRADPSVNTGVIQGIQIDEHTLVIKTDGVKDDFSILINPCLVDVSEPIHITTNAGEYTVKVNPSAEILRQSIRETGDPSLGWVAEIPYTLLTGGALPTDDVTYENEYENEDRAADYAAYDDQADG
ncbi:MAG: hypothetical protein J6U01_04450 [Clostridia bacterium]|nr:hypothetical protein [Clostridia bacterium]